MSSNFKRNKKIIDKLIILPNLKENKDYISNLVNKIQITDFSYLANMPKEKIKEEKSKIYKQIIYTCK